MHIIAGSANLCKPFVRSWLRSTIVRLGVSIMKKRYLFCVCVLAAAAAAGSLTAQEKPFSAFPNALGMFGTTLAGNAGGGLHYQRWGEKWGFQVTAGGLYDPEASLGRTLDYSVMLEGTRALFTNYYGDFFAGRLYVWSSAGHQGFIEGEDPYEAGGDAKPGVLVLDALAGFGIGIESVLLQHFSFPFQFGYTGSFPSTPRVGFTVEGGFRYRY